MDGQGCGADRTTRSGDRRHTTLGWSCSLLVHGLVLAGTMALGGRVQLHPPAEPFRWDVALVHSAGGESPLPQPQAPAHMSRDSHAAKNPTQSHTTPITSTAVQGTRQALGQPVNPVVQQRIETVPTNVAVRQESPQAMVSHAVMRETIAPITRSGEGVARQLMQTHEGAQPHKGTTSLRGHAVEPSIISRAATVSFSQEGSTDSDYGWLAETLWTRVQALKRYPSKAAADRLEGDVLLTAVVKADGAISEIRVMKSSGYPLLDQAAIEVVRNTSPLALLRPLDHAQVSVEIPIAYHVHN